MQQAQKQAAINHEDAQASPGGGGGGRRGGAAKRRRMTWWRSGGADLESALQVDLDHGDSLVAPITTLSSCGSEAARSSVAGPPKGGVYRPARSSGCSPATASACASSPSRTRQQPDHPDQGGQLKLLAKVLERFIKGVTTKAAPMPVFDFRVAFRKVRRQATQGDGAIRQGPLEYDGWYGHRKTLTSSSPGYRKLPERLQIPGRHEAEYDYEDRYRLRPLHTHPSLPHTMRSVFRVAALRVFGHNRQGYDYVLDPRLTRARSIHYVIEGCAAACAALAPPVFKEDLDQDVTSPKADLETVGNLYEKEFDEQLGEATG